MKILGYHWDFISTDITEGRSGNQERMIFVYDKRKVKFQNIAGEIVLPESSLIGKEKQFARTPFIVSFQANWFKFNLCTVHLYYGDKSEKKLKRRIEEIKKITEFLAKRADEEDISYIILGDFNIEDLEDETMKALLSGGFKIPNSLWGVSSTNTSTYFDQIAYREKDCRVKFGKRAGTFNFFNFVFQDDEANTYFEYMDKKNRDISLFGNVRDQDAKIKYYKKWRTWQMSDHFPLYVELIIDSSDEYLESLKKI